MRIPLLVAFLGLCLSPAFAQTQTPGTTPPVNTPALLALQNDVTQVVSRVKPSVVTVVCEKPASANDDDDDEDAPTAPPPKTPGKPTTPPEEGASLGTGWVFRTDGYIITNYHVVRGATSVRVLFNADTEDVERVAAQLVGYDADADLAIIKVNRTKLPALEIADSDALQVGSWTIAVGAPFDQPQTVTLGVLSATGRHIEKNGTPSSQVYLQTDASINPGNSGGPLLDLNGRVVGLNTAILSPSRASAGIGFAIPANNIKALIPLLLTGKQIKRGFVGIQYSRLAPDVAREFGLDGGLQVGGLATKPSGGPTIGPAKDAGIQEGDIIYAVDGNNISTVEAFRALITGMAPGAKVTLSVARPDFNGAGNVQKIPVTITLGDRDKVLGTTAAAFSLPVYKPIVGTGLSVVDAKTLNATQKEKYDLKGTESGAVITDIVPASNADEADLREGLRIVRVREDEKWMPVATATDWKTLEKSAKPGAHLLVQLRDGSNMSVYRVIVIPGATTAMN